MVTRMRSLLLAVNASTSRRGNLVTGAVNQKPVKGRPRSGGDRLFTGDTDGATQWV